MKAKKSSAKKGAESQPAAKLTAEKKTAHTTKATPRKNGLIQRLQSALKAKPAKTPASAPKRAAAKNADRHPPKPAKTLAGKIKVQETIKPQKKAAAASSPAKAAVTPAPAPKADRAKVNHVTRGAGALLTEDEVREMSDDDYMNEAQLEFFRLRLLQMREEVLQRELEVKERLHEREVFADPADRATAEEEHWLDLRLRERESLLLKKIDEALRRIEAKEYGYCEKTGDPIGIPRLLARPTATVCVDVKGQDERVEAQFRDR
jgi:DnaK suppressor protein